LPVQRTLFRWPANVVLARDVRTTVASVGSPHHTGVEVRRASGSPVWSRSPPLCHTPWPQAPEGACGARGTGRFHTSRFRPLSMHRATEVRDAGAARHDACHRATDTTSG